MPALDMAVQIRPAQTRRIALIIRAVIPQQQHRILKDVHSLVLDPEVIVRADEVVATKRLEPLRRVVREYDKLGFRLHSISLIHTNQKKVNSLGNAHTPSSCTARAAAAHRYGTSGDCTAQRPCARSSTRR